MLDLSLRDGTQKKIIDVLDVTEALLSSVATKLTGRAQGAEIVALPDLGMPNNVTRICGGFFTGALYRWETGVPFVPVDATVNVDSVTLFELCEGFDSEAEFNCSISKAARDCKPYVWNFDVGNHFVTFGELRRFAGDESRYCLLLHSSAAEYKAQSVGLYPMAKNWYSDEIQIEWAKGKQSHRYLRYIKGGAAERFYALAKKLEPYNFDRHCYFAERICGKRLQRSVVSRVHYGMPDPSSVSIGCQLLKEGDDYVLLTAPGQDMFLLSASRGGKNLTNAGRSVSFILPHGLGKRFSGECSFALTGRGLILNGQYYSPGQSLANVPGLEIRYDKHRGRPVQLDQMLAVCPSEIRGSIRQIYSFDARSQI